MAQLTEDAAIARLAVFVGECAMAAEFNLTGGRDSRTGRVRVDAGEAVQRQVHLEAGAKLPAVLSSPASPPSGALVGWGEMPVAG